MNKIMLLLVVFTGFVATMPISANALDPQVVSQNPHGETNLLIAQYRRDQNRDRDQNYDRDRNYDRNQNRDRQFSVYYRNSNDRQWTLESSHTYRRDAQRAANRLEQRGYRTYVQVSRRVNSGMNRG